MPTAADADHYRRELAAAGVVFGAQVLSASRFARELVRRSGVGGRPLGPLARERVAAAVAGRTPLEALAASARTPGFARALLRLADELAEHRVDPGRFAGAMRAWGAEEPARAGYASELARLHGALRHALDGLGRPDPILRAFAALDALRTEPRRWGGAPVFLYGFDDLSALQLDAVATLARHAGAEVTVSLTYEPGRAAFAGRGSTIHELAALADRHEALEARADHYAPASRAALHHLERALFEPEPPPPVAPGAAVRLLEGGGQRAELELVAAQIASLLADDGLAPEDVAVVLRDPGPRLAAAARGVRRLWPDGGAGPPRARRAHRDRPRRRRPAAQRGPRRLGRRAAHVAAHPRPAGAPGPGRRARGARAPARAPPRPSRRARCGRGATAPSS